MAYEGSEDCEGCVDDVYSVEDVCSVEDVYSVDDVEDVDDVYHVYHIGMRRPWRTRRRKFVLFDENKKDADRKYEKKRGSRTSRSLF